VDDPGTIERQGGNKALFHKPDQDGVEPDLDHMGPHGPMEVFPACLAASIALTTALKSLAPNKLGKVSRKEPKECPGVQGRPKSFRPTLLFRSFKE